MALRSSTVFRKHLLLASFAAPAALLTLWACAASPRTSASGRVAGYDFRTTVDSEVARDYLEGRGLPKTLAELRARYRDTSPSREALSQVAREYSPDVATLLFVESLSAQPEMLALRTRYQKELGYVQRMGPAQAGLEPPKDLLILMVPGWFYLVNGHETNADFRIQRRLYEQWGIPHQLVPIDQNGSIEENARIVADAIREHSRSHRLFVVSASKSGAEVAMALGSVLKPDESTNVVAWLSIVGAVRGSPLADRVTKSDLCWLIRAKLAFDGFGLDGLLSMRAEQSRARFARLRFPAHLKRFSLIAVPLSGNISDRGSFGYGHMREAGPNDGLTLLADELIPGAVSLLLPGVDHFLGAEDQRLWSTAVFRTLLAQVPRARASVAMPQSVMAAP